LVSSMIKTNTVEGQMAFDEFDNPAYKSLIDFFNPVKPNSNCHEIESEKMVSNIISEFLNRKNITANTGLEQLFKNFDQGIVPTELSNLNTYLKFLNEHVIPYCINTSSPKFIGHMTTALPNFIRELAKLMVGMNQNVVKMETSKVMTLLERQSLTMIHRMIYRFAGDFYAEHIQNKDSTLGIITSGGTIANLTATWCARNVSLGLMKDEFLGIEKEGFPAALNYYGFNEAVIIGSQNMHYSFEKAADFLGIGLKNYIRVPADENHRMKLNELSEIIRACRKQRKHIIAIIAVAGATDSGAIDPLDKIAEIAGNEKIYFHVDAAWGGPLVFSQKYNWKLQGIELADSVTIDGHKQLYLPMGIGIVLFKNPKLAAVIEKRANYIIRENSFDLGKRSLEGSRPGMSLYLHAALNIIGQKGYEILIDEGLRKIQYLADVISQKSEFELLLQPEINILLYRYLPKKFREKVASRPLTKTDNRIINGLNEQIQKSQRKRGHSFVSRTTIYTEKYGKDTPIVALRIVIANPLTQESDLNDVLNEQLEISKIITA
jgi:putative pyridoxal-dependent aspartate 1-decarboxylase